MDRDGLSAGVQASTKVLCREKRQRDGTLLEAIGCTTSFQFNHARTDLLTPAAAVKSTLFAARLK